jgi:hypothetical protein
MTDEKRYLILSIKDKLWTHPQYRQTLLSVHIYEAVLENGIMEIDGFWEWWKIRYGSGNG